MDYQLVLLLLENYLIKAKGYVNIFEQLLRLWLDSLLSSCLPMLVSNCKLLYIQPISCYNMCWYLGHCVLYQDLQILVISLIPARATPSAIDSYDLMNKCKAYVYLCDLEQELLPYADIWVTMFVNPSLRVFKDDISQHLLKHGKKIKPQNSMYYISKFYTFKNF